MGSSSPVATEEDSLSTGLILRLISK